MSSTIISLVSGLGGMLGWGIYDFFAGVYSKKIGPFKTFFWSQVFGFVFILLLALVFTASFAIPLGIGALVPVAALVYSAGYLLFMKGFAIGNISIVAAIMNLWAVFTMVFAFLFMGQRLSGTQLAGVCLIVFGAVMTSLNWREIQNKRLGLSAGVKQTVLGAFFFGVFWNISEMISEQIGWLPTTVLVKGGIILVLFFGALAMKRQIGLAKANARTKWVVALMGVLEAAAVALVNFGLTIGDAILITPIASALSVVTICMAILFLKDKITRLQGAGMVLAVAGIVFTGF